MKKIVLNRDFAFVYLNKEFYQKNKILETLDVYKEIFSGSLKEVGKYFVIKVEKQNDDYELEKLCNEFCNYSLSMEYGVKM